MLIARLKILVLLLFVTASVQASADPLAGQVQNVSGDAFLTGPDGKPVKIAANTSLPPGSKISTGAGSKLVIQWAPGLISIITANASLSVTSLSSNGLNGVPNIGISLNLLKGSIFSHIPAKDGKSSLRVTTLQGDATTSGADWKVTTGKGDTVTISCVTGSINVAAQSGPLSLRHGQLVTLPLGTVGTLTADQTLEILDLLAGADVTVDGLAMVDHHGDNGAGTAAELPYTRDHFIVPTSR